MAATNKCLAKSNKSRTGGKATKKRFSQSMDIDWASMRHDAPASQIDRAPSRAHSAQDALWRLSRELPRWKRDHGLLHRQPRKRRQHRGRDGPQAWTITMLKTLIIATMLLPRLAIAQRSQQLPQPRQPGQWCPVGWMTSGSYRVPGSEKALAASSEARVWTHSLIQ
jgi:hypothetical protein